MKEYKKNCPNCGKEQSYSRSDLLTRAKKNNTLCNSCSAKKYKKGILNGTTEEQRKKMRATKAGFSSWDEYVDKYPKKEMYKREVWKCTYKNNLESLDNYEKRGISGIDGAYQIDHIISINEGWELGIPPEKIGNINNLQMLPWRVNRNKA